MNAYITCHKLQPFVIKLSYYDLILLIVQMVILSFPGLAITLAGLSRNNPGKNALLMCNK